MQGEVWGVKKGKRGVRREGCETSRWMRRRMKREREGWVVGEGVGQVLGNRLGTASWSARRRSPRCRNTCNVSRPCRGSIGMRPWSRRGGGRLGRDKRLGLDSDIDLTEEGGA